jgi:hypothetical protein
MDGLVYYAICSTCGSEAQRAVAGGTDSTYAVRARDGRRVWRFNGGKYANPVVADDERIYITGRAHQFALAPKGSKTVKEYLRRARAAKQRRERRAEERAARADRREKRRRDRSRSRERRERREDRG